MFEKIEYGEIAPVTFNEGKAWALEDLNNCVERKISMKYSFGSETKSIDDMLNDINEGTKFGLDLVHSAMKFLMSIRKNRKADFQRLDIWRRIMSVILVLSGLSMFILITGDFTELVETSPGLFVSLLILPLFIFGLSFFIINNLMVKMFKIKFEAISQKEIVPLYEVRV